MSLIGSAFHTKEQETYDIQGQYWLTQTETSENLGVGTYMEHARNYLNATVGKPEADARPQAKQQTSMQACTFKLGAHHRELKEYEMRDSSGYSVPHTGEDLYMIYSLNARNELKAQRVEAYLQDTYKFASGETFFTLNYGVRFSHWNFNRESIVSAQSIAQA